MLRKIKEAIRKEVVQRIFEILDLTPENEGEKDIEVKHGEIVFDNISSDRIE